MNIGRLKLKPKGSSTSKSGSPLPPVQVPPNLSQFSSPSNLGPNKSPVVSRSEPSVRFKLEEDIIGSLSVSSASASGSNNEDSLEIMEEIDIPDDESTHDNDASGSISENLVLSAAPAENVPQRSVDNSKIATDRKRQLFDIDNELPGESGVRKFDIDDLQLSGDEIAQHFQSFSESTDPKDEDIKVNLAVKKKLLKQNHDVGSLGTLLDNIESSSDVLESDPKKEESDLKQKVGESKKEYSPLNEDVVLINNSKVSLKSLKKLQKQPNVLDNSGDNSYSTTNDISELARDTESDRIMSDNNDNSSRSDVASKPMDSDKEASLQKLSSLMLRSKSAEIEEKNVQSEDKPEFASLGVVKLCNEQSSEVHDSSVEEDNSIEEMLMSNASVDILAVNEMVLLENQQLKEDSSDSNLSGDLKEKILTSSKSFEEVKSQHELDVPADNLEGNKPVVVKQMEKVVDSKEALEDISEESEQTLTNSNHSETRPNTDDEQSKPLAVVEKGKEIRKILEEKLLHKQLNIESTIYEDNKENIPDSLSANKSFDLDSVVSLNMFQAMNNEIKQLHEIIATKDMMLEAYSTRDSLKETRLESLRDPQRSSDSSSLATNSTEYRPLNDETASKKELLQKVADQNQWIVTLAEKLQEINQAREVERSESIKLVAEVNRLTKQLAENADTIKQRPHWMRDQESTGQRISEISIDLVSETDDALSDFPDIYEERSNRNSRERQLDLNLDIDYSEQNPLHIPTAISKQLEQFRKYLSADELRLFNMVQGKFDDYLQQELDKMKTTSEEELKIIQERLVSEKNEHDAEVGRLRQLLSNVKSGSVEIEDLKSELEARHTQEMDDLRTYFQEKVAEFEKQYSEKVLSQHSRQMSNDTASDISDQEEFPEENGGYHSKHTSPKRKAKEDIYLSPTHRKITPTTIDTTESSADEVMEIPMEEEDEAHLTVDSLREYYQNKLKELKRQHEQDLRELRKTFKQFEEKDIDEKGLPNNEDPITSKDTSPHTIEEVTVTSATKPECLPPSAGVILIDKSTTSTTNTTTVDIGTEPIDDLHEIIADYERRLQEQVALARQDVLRELEVQIQALLSDTISEDYHWPPELILLREKLTAKSQLEIAQLQIKHEEEMAKVKADFEKQLQWKLKRQSTFDSARDLDKIISERDNLRELSSTLRSVLCELVRYVSNCEDDLNSTVIDELHKYGIVPGNAEEVLECSALDMSVSNISTLSTKKFLKFTPDVSGLISIIEDPTLLEYISKESANHDGANRSLNLDECLEKLRSEAMHILSLSEKIAKKSSTKDEDLDKVSVKSDSCEEEDGLKRKVVKKDTVGSRSFDENMVRNSRTMDTSHIDSSLPMDLTALQCSGELNVQLHELRNEKRQLEMKLADALSKQNSLVVELNETKQHLLELNSQKVEISEGYGTNALLPCAQKQANSFSELQEKAKQILASSPDSDIDNSTNLLQLVEEFCREGERYMENGKRDKLDLQSQIDAADKQLKATRQFLEDQAAEREQERDEFVKEIEKLKIQLREKDKDKTNIDRVTKEDGFLCDSCSCGIDNREIIEKLETAEQNIKELSAEIAARDDKIRKLENDLKDSIDKGFTLREIITELETQNESKAIDQHVMVTKIKELENYIDAQNRQNESLHQETDMTVRGYDDKIAKLEEELRQTKPSVEHSLVLEALTVQLRDVEETLERKTKNLETLHANSSASLVCSSPSEDISVNSPSHRKKSAENSSMPPLPVDEVQRIFDKLHRHTRVEEVAIKRINDLEMQICSVRNEYVELQHERDVLQERMSEQSLKITTLQSKLDEQRLRAEELHRQGTSHLTVKVHDLQNEVVNLKETLQTRDKQITSLKNFLENSQQVIERQEKELAMNQADNDRSQYELKLEAELQAKCDEIQQLKNKIQNDMINKLALPDLMETMLADKNEEIDQLKEKLSQLQSQHHPPASHLGHGKEDDNARTLSDIVSITDCDESDMVMRRLPEQNEGLLPTQHSIPMETPSNFFNLKEHHQTASTTQSTTHLPSSSSNVSPLQHALQLPKATLFPLGFEGAFLQDFSAVFPRPTPSTGTSSGGTPEFIPRHINFSLIDDPRSTEGKDCLREPAFIEEIHEQEEEKVMAQTMTASGGKRLSDISENVSEEDKGKLENELESLKMQLDRITNEKNVALERMHAEIQEKNEKIEDLQVELAARNKLYEDLLREKKDLRDELEKVKHDLDQLESDACNLQKKEDELKEVLESMTHKDQELCDLKGICNKLREEIEQHVRDSETLKSEQQKNHLLIDTLKQQVESLNKTIGHKDELMSKLEKDILNYSKNEEKYLEQLKVLDAKEIELRLLQGNYKDRMQEIEMLNEDNKFLNEDITRLKNEIAKSSSNSSSNPSYVQFLKQNCEKIEEELRETKTLLTEKMLALERVKIDLTSCQREAEDVKCLLKEKEMIIQQIGDDGNTLHQALSNIQNQMQETSGNLNKKLREEQDRNTALLAEIERLKTLLQRSDNSSSPKPFSVEEIAEQLEKELNYSAQLDSSILKAIESDDVNSDDEANEAIKKSKDGLADAVQLEELTQKLRMEAEKGNKLKEMLEAEKHNSNEIQMQDAEIIEAMRLRLEAAIDNEGTLQKLLSEERSKNERLSTLMAGVQRTKSFDNYLLMKNKSPHDSPSRRLNRSNEFESEMVARFESEIKFLNAQNERERERAIDLQRALERERNRFEKEIADRNEYGEQVKRELMRVTKEKERLEVELDNEQEKLLLSHKEIESLERRINALQEAESMRSLRKDRSLGQNSLEFQDLRLRLENLEQERVQLLETNRSLRTEVERRKQNEAHLMEALSRDNSLKESGVPEEFLTKLKDLNRMLEANARENHQQAETLRLMVEERRALQQRIQELERFNVNSNRSNRDDLEERANHLFGKYLRSESHRKALVHQKRYLQIVLTTYEENEAKALQLLNAQNVPMGIQGLSFAKPNADENHPRRKSFRSVVTAIIAIERMKFIVRKWQGGRRVCAKAIFSQQFTPRRSQSATTNVWTRSQNSHFVEYNASPPSRDRAVFHPSVVHQVQNYPSQYLRLPESQLVMNADLRERLEDQYNQTNR